MNGFQGWCLHLGSRLGIVGLAVAFATVSVAHPASVAETAEDSSGSDWRCLAVNDEPPTGWHRWAFDDGKWATTRDPFGPGDECRGANGTTAGPRAVVVLLRREVMLPPRGEVSSLVLETAGNGPLVLYLNGIEIFRSLRPFSTTSKSPTSKPKGLTVDLTGIAHEFLPGRNVVALEIEVSGQSVWAAPELHMELGRSESGASNAGPPAGMGHEPNRLPTRGAAGGIRHLILMIADGWGPKHLEAANQYLGEVPAYQQGGPWASHWIATFPVSGAYDGTLAWSDFTYPMSGATDSAAAATAMFSGSKTSNGRISVDASGAERFLIVGELARRIGMAVGAVSTVQIAHATPGAFTSHNLLRGNGYAIGDEAFFGHPNTTGSTGDDAKYGGGFGRTLPPVDVLVGDRAETYLHPAQRDKLAAESGLPGKHRLVEGVEGVAGGPALLGEATDPECRMLAGLFDRKNLWVSEPEGGYRYETPTLAEAAEAALTVLQRDPHGFVLMVEGGAVDWASHGNNMDRMLGELRDFYLAVETVVDWVDLPGNGTDWSNTLVVITGDHETGYLTAAPGVFQNVPLAPGSLTPETLALEKVYLQDSGRRASWVDDSPANDQIDDGETVYWVWNSVAHTNTLIPLYARGVGAELFADLAVERDPVRGAYSDNTAVFSVTSAVLAAADTLFVDGFESGDVLAWPEAQHGQE